jgi:cytochrome P450
LSPTPATRRASLEDGYRLYELVEIVNTGLVGDPRSAEAGLQLFTYATELAGRKRADPADDIATSLLLAEGDGQRLTDMEFNFFFVLLISAGGDTTRNLVAGGMCVLMDHPELSAPGHPSSPATHVVRCPSWPFGRTR